MPKEKLVVMDGMSYAYRSFYAIRELTNSSGRPLNAVFGFLMAMQKIQRDFNPEYAVVAFDAPGPTFRDEILKDYKAQRQPTPEPLKDQIQEILELVPLLGWQLIAVPGFEADDIMATLGVQATKKGIETILFSSDKDLLQMVDGQVKVYRENPMGGSLYGAKEVQERYGVPPECIPDLLGLMGDSADNIPGVPGIGEKTAGELLKQFGSLEKILASIGKINKPKLAENLKQFSKQAQASREMAVLVTKVPLEQDFAKLRLQEPQYGPLIEKLRKFEFKKLLAEFSAKAGQAMGAAVSTAPESAKLKKIKGALARLKVLKIKSSEELKSALKNLEFDAHKPISVMAFPEEAPKSLALAQDSSAIVLSEGQSSQGWGGVLAPFKKMVLFRSKPLRVELLRSGFELDSKLMDVEVISYLLNPSRPWRDLNEAAAGVGTELPELPKIAHDLLGVDGESLAQHAHALALLAEPIAHKLEKEGIQDLYNQLEAPLITVLAKMEHKGVKLDLKVLETLEAEAQKGMSKLKAKAVQLAGQEFNLNSPSQLADILFNKLGLPPQKKTKTGYSTDLEVLEILSSHHELPAVLLEYRTLAKLSSTYLQALPKLVDLQDQRLHCSWNQAVAATGRLSSSDPNLQNIPIRTELGRQVRKAFIPERKGDLILSADYSQIELRILAHYCEDEALMGAFQKKEDIHAKTASKVLGLPLEKVDEEMRRRAKVINFGILYGMSPFGLSKELGTSQAEAKDFIQAYFAQFPKVKAFLASCVEQAQKQGFVSTLMGRRRYIPEINSANRNLREFAERTAVNTPIQGSAADLIKKAMLDVDSFLTKKKARSFIILQIHDELVFELAKEEADWLPQEIQKIMEKSMDLKVPLKVGIGKGKNWYEAKQ